jgi:hypothetical protein
MVAFMMPRAQVQLMNDSAYFDVASSNISCYYLFDFV